MRSRAEIGLTAQQRHKRFALRLRFAHFRLNGVD
jgi:hypothetical protein